MHGNQSLLAQYLNYLEIETLPVKDNQERYFYKNKLLTKAQSEEKKKLKKALAFFDRIYQYKGHEIGLLDFLKEKKYYKNTAQILEGLASEYGTDLAQLGYRSLAIDENNWHSGELDYVLPQHFGVIFRNDT